MKVRIGFMNARVASVVTAARALGARFVILGVILATVMLRGRSDNDASLGTALTWVHPTDGVDPATTPTGMAMALTYINDPSLKFKTLQRAIDTMESFLILNYHSVNNPDQQGIVYALPGLYGPHGVTASSNDSLPILMRDRVHVQGLGARRCVIRGVGTVVTPAGSYPVPFPTQPAGPTVSSNREVLVSYLYATPLDVFPNIMAPWFPSGAALLSHDTDIPEVFDAFTLEGGDLQILLEHKRSQADYFPAARISNCVFDLRHEWTGVGTSKLAGPYFGIMMLRFATFDSGPPGPVGYLDGRVLIANNTFIFARWNNAALNDGWESESRPETVGIIDVTEANCAFQFDLDSNFRGVGNPCIVSNLFRTRPPHAGAAASPYAMLGVEAVDTEVVFDYLTGVRVQTNAFDPARTGSTNGYFWSVPVVSTNIHTSTAGTAVWNCQITSYGPCSAMPGSCTASPAPSPLPAVPIWDGAVGSVGVDPGFVGEYIATSTSLTDYRDWRLLPGSPLEDMGFLPPATPHAFRTSPHATGAMWDTTWDFDVSFPAELSMYQWDGEHWGNPRSVNGAPDVGFDERGLLTCAGNWANDSNSHNQTGLFMHPTASVGGSTRYFILPDIEGGVALNVANRSVRFYQTILVPPSPPSTGNAWINPPLSLATPVVAPADSGLPFDYRTKYVGFTQALPWADQPLFTAVGTYLPLLNLSQTQLNFRLVTLLDDECSQGPCTESYFNMQGVVIEPSTLKTLLRGNMQGEYR